MSKKTTIILITIIALILIGGGVYLWWENNEKTPRTYSEVFNPPIDPNLEPEKHKEVYEKIQKTVHFPVLYPETMPEGWKLTKGESKSEANVSLGYSKTTYQKEDQSIEIFEGVGDVGMVKDLGEVELKNKEKGWLWKDGENIGITLPNSSSSYNYFIVGTNVSKEEIINIANLIHLGE